MRAVLLSLLTQDTRLSYVLLIAGTVLFAVLAGFVAGLPAAITAALAQPGSSPNPD